MLRHCFFALMAFILWPRAAYANLCQPFIDVLPVMEATCLSSSSIGGSGGFSLKISDLKKMLTKGGGIGFDAKARLDKIKGAVNYMDEAIRSAADKDIRTCLSKFQDRLLNCLDEEVKQKSSQRPTEILLYYQVTGTTPGPKGKFINSNDYLIGFKQPSKRPDIPIRKLEGWFYEPVGMPRDNQIIEGIVAPTGYESHLENLSQISTKFCLQPSQKPPTSSLANEARLSCKIGGVCGIVKDLDPGWLQVCSAMRSDNQWQLAQLISQAHAQDKPEPFWYVPSLATLDKRSDLSVGYTVFNLSTDDHRHLDADGYRTTVIANGHEVREDGLPSEYRTIALTPGRRLNIVLALQNLDFSGVRKGCDRIEVKVQFVKDGAPVGALQSLSWEYVPLRDAPEIRLESPSAKWTMSGKYNIPKHEADHEVFIQSWKFNSETGIPSSELSIAVQSAKNKIDHLGFKFEDRPVVGVIRPPMEDNHSMGLAIGIIEPSGQIRFTFSKDQAKKLRERALEFAGTNKDAEKLIDKGTYVYRVDGDSRIGPRNYCQSVS